jgi:hypothetical protein
MVEYEKWIRNELKENKIRVHRWGEFNDDETYYAYFESRRVYIPRPICTYSLLIALHEIGHLVRGNHKYGYIAEYEAEMWAINTALKKYNIKNKKYETSSKVYVYENLLEDIVFRFLPLHKIQKRIIKWIGVSLHKIKKDVINFYGKIKKEYQILKEQVEKYSLPQYI